ncbi:MAG: TolC family protein [candidate division Zixibacteria bacterium]|nr:TolC family protein [candidate division Zixibacteria bacterium]MBU2626764.1 TolC family protein [candidate division Zixibacteria bacterium]
MALADAKNRLIALVQEIYDTYVLRREIIALEEQNIKAARQNLDLQRERHELGVANSLEFRDAQQNSARARTSLITARYQARISRLEIDRLIGMIDIER